MPTPLNKLHFLVKATNSKLISRPEDASQFSPTTTQFFNSSSFMHHLTVQSIDRNEIGTKIKMAFVQCFGETTKHRFYFQCKLCFIHLFSLLCRFVTSLKCFSCTNAFFSTSPVLFRKWKNFTTFARDAIRGLVASIGAEGLEALRSSSRQLWEFFEFSSEVETPPRVVNKRMQQQNKISNNWVHFCQCFYLLFIFWKCLRAPVAFQRATKSREIISSTSNQNGKFSALTIPSMRILNVE